MFLFATKDKDGLRPTVTDPGTHAIANLGAPREIVAGSTFVSQRNFFAGLSSEDDGLWFVAKLIGVPHVRAGGVRRAGGRLIFPEH
jgi:hypothetical protein